METPMLSKYMGYQHHNQGPIIYTHTHTHRDYISLHMIIHVSTRTCHIHHKRGLTEVWHIACFWVSYGRCAMPGLPIGWSEGLSWQWAD